MDWTVLLINWNIAKYDIRILLKKYMKPIKIQKLCFEKVSSRKVIIKMWELVKFVVKIIKKIYRICLKYFTKLQ